MLGPTRRWPTTPTSWCSWWKWSLRRQRRRGTDLTYKGRELDLQPPTAGPPFWTGVRSVGEPLSFDQPIEAIRDLARKTASTPADGHGRIAAEIYESSSRTDLGAHVRHGPSQGDIASSREHRKDRTDERFELVIAGTEYANAFSDLVDPLISGSASRPRPGPEAGDEKPTPSTRLLRALETGCRPRRARNRGRPPVMP